MNNLINNYLKKLTKEQITSFALMHNIVLSKQELEFTYKLVKSHGLEIINNYDNFNLDSYKQYYSENNFEKIKILFKEYSLKFKPFLN